MLGGDWSDEESRTGATESIQTTAQASWAGALREVVARQWTMPVTGQKTITWALSAG